MHELSPSQPVPSRGRLVSFPALPALVAIAVLATTAWAMRGVPRVLTIDDAYITLHSARALLAGGDASYGSPILSGITSAPHLVLVAITQAIAPGESSVLALGWLALVLYALVLVRLARTFALGAPWQALLVLAGLTAGLLLPLHALNGLETGLAMAAFTWTLALLRARPGSHDRPRLGLAVLIGTLPYLRPELAPFSAALMLLRLGETQRAADRATARIAWLRELAAALLAAAPWALAYGLTTGTPWPSTLLVKSAWRADSCLPMAERLATLWGGLVERLPGAVAVGAVFLPLDAAGVAGIAAVAFFLVTALTLFPFVTGLQDGRYTVLFVPLLVYGLGLGLSAARPLLRRLATVLLVVATAYDLARLPEAFALNREARSFIGGETAANARWLREHLPANARVLVHDAGYVAFATPFTLIDVVGLKSPGSAVRHREITLPSCGTRRGEAIADIATAARATYLVTLAEWEQRFGFVAALEHAGWRVERLRNGHSGYSVYALTQPGGGERR
ncbi:MAG: hypothetical protein ABI609_08685 [Acidobacteriota bacterium]